MKYLWLIWFFVLGGVFYAYKNIPQSKPDVFPVGVDEKLYRRGRAIYRSRCTSCHNANPDLAGSVGPALRGVPEDRLIDRLTNGKGAMPPQPDMLRHAKAIREFLK